MGGARLLRCHKAAGLVRCTDMEPTEAEKREGRRAQLLLCALVAVMVTLPIVLLILRTR